MKRLAVLLLVLCAPVFGASACGPGDDEGGALDNALGYLPADTPFVFVVSTDIEGDDYERANALLKEFPFGGQAGSQIKSQLEQGGVDYDDDVKPILGNDLVLGVPSADAFQQEPAQFVMALEAKDGGKAEDLVQKDADKVGEAEGADIYESSGGTFTAFKDDTIVLSNTQEQVEQALETRAGDDKLSEDDVNEAFEDLPEDALVRIYGDAESLIEASPEAQQAQEVQWVGALRKFGLTLNAEEDALAVEFNVQTEEGELEDEDLPIQPGADSPGIVERANEIGLALKNPAHVARFGEGALQSAASEEFGQYQAGKSQLGSQLGIDIDRDVLEQLEGDATVSVALDGSFAVRADVTDADALSATLEKATEDPDVIEGLADGNAELETPGAGEDLYALVPAFGDPTVFGVVDDVFVLANDPEKAEQIAAGEPEPVDGAEGAVVMKADAEAIANQAIQMLPSDQLQGLGLLGGAEAFTGPLGELTGSMQADTSGLSGSFRLGIGE
jgi:Protein of unknown function (DUF3352)